MLPTLKEIREGLFRYEEPDKGFFLVFSDPGKLLEAGKRLREKGIKRMDSFTPFALHGLEEALGVSRSWIPAVTFVMGLLGAVGGFLFMTWVHAIDWPLIIGGKPYFAWPAYIPITFELMVLIGGVSTVVALLYLGRLYKPSRKPPLARVSSDQYVLWVGEDISQEEVKSLVGDLVEEIKEVKE